LDVESYLTVTAHFITAEWEIKSLQTRPLQSSDKCKLEELREVVAVWKLGRYNIIIPVTARNIINAFTLAGLGPQRMLC
jgi:hypothetical protein